MQRWKALRGRTKALIIGVAVVVVLVIIGVTAPSDDSGGDEAGSSAPPATTAAAPTTNDADTPATTRPDQPTGPPPLRDVVQTAVLEGLGDDPDWIDDWGPGDRIRRVWCTENRYCFVNYNADEPVVKPTTELVEDMRPVFGRAFEDSRLRELTLWPYGVTTSIGGKESINRLMVVRCDRADNAQIDWENVDKEGVQAICDYAALVNFE